MKNLKRLIQGLKATEIQFINDFYQIKSYEKSKRSVLFNLLINNAISSNQDAIKKIYPDKTNGASALSHLKKKLYEDILNLILVIAPDIESKGEINPEFQCKKSLLQSEILISRGLFDEGLSILEKTFKIAEKYEFPEINIASYNLLMNYNIKSNKNYPDHFFDKSIHNYQKILKAKEAYLFGKNRNSFRESDSSSNKVHFWNELTEVEKLVRQCSFESAKSKALDLKHYITTQKFCLSDSARSKLSKSLALIYLNLQDYDESIQYSNDAISLLPNHLPEYQSVSIILFFAFLRSGNNKKAEEIFISSSKNHFMDNNFKNKWILLKGLLDFNSKNYKNVYSTLSKYKIKYSENSNWCLTPRFLELLTILETDDFEWFEFRLECLRKKLTKLKDSISYRSKVIFSLLQSLIRIGFNYNKLLVSEKDKFSLLVSQSPEYYWDPTGHELINIPNWILQKSKQFNSSNIFI